MKLFYFQRTDGLQNFGDWLNAWLWPQLLPGVFDEDDTTTFVGIGTLLNKTLPRRVPAAKKLIIFSTGVGYEQALTSIPNNWQIYCVRGFLSAKQLGLSNEFVVADGALLVRRLFQLTGEKKYRFAFMPHVHYAKFAGSQWQEICQQIGFHYIDPCWPTEKVLSAISQTEVILAEAMHGAIVADALRVPWIPITTSPRILGFKWQDWCSSMKVEYRPCYIIPLLDSYPQYGRGMRSFWQVIKHWGNCLWQNQVDYLSLSWGDKQRWCATQLLGIAKTARPCLSNEVQVERLTVELENRLEQFKTDLRSGKF